MKKLIARFFVVSWAVSGVVAAVVSAQAQVPAPVPAAIPAVTGFSPEAPQGLSITRDAVPSHRFSVVGPRGAVLGEQDGSYELWLFPWKILSDMRIEAEMQNYPVPIDVNAHASSITVTPEATTITFAHANFTVRETMFAPKQTPDGAGAVVFYQIEAVRPMTLTFSFAPMFQRMWPAMSDNPPGTDWVKTAGGSGFYVLSGDFPEYAAAVAMPTAEPGILPPYQERAHYYPLQFVLHFDPKRDADKVFPLLVTMGNTIATSTVMALDSQLLTLDRELPALYAANRKYYEDFQAKRLSIDTPDKRLNKAFSWAEVSIDQLRVETTPNHDEEALTAGFVGSADSVRPGFGWFFGRDGLWSLYAVNSYGGFDTARQEIEFLLKRESPEGKIPHEWSQTADIVDWKALPYEYAAADATPLLPMAVNDYLRISGDKAFVAANWDAIARAWHFECTHDTDGDGIYDNSQGSGWVESWIPKMPHQEMYLAALDEQASLAFANLAKATGHDDLAQQATQRAQQIRATIEKEYYLPQTDFYAFSWNGKEGTDDTPTIFPAVAWWDGDYAPEHGEAMLRRWASEEFSTDWGTRDVGDHVSFYDPISYHQGTVWPLYTGWASVAEYRAGRPLAGWQHLEQNAGLTWTGDLGNTTELLSGEFFHPLGRSTAHQLWSSAMVISPVVRGLFGIEWDAADGTLSVTPSLPASWNHASMEHLPFGDKAVDLAMQRDGDWLVLRATGTGAAQVRLISKAEGAKVADGELRIPLPPVEVEVDDALPEPGAMTSQVKVLDQQRTMHSLNVTLAAPAGTSQAMVVRINDPKLLDAKKHKSVLRVSGVDGVNGTAPLQTVTIRFDSTAPGTSTPGTWVEKQISFQW